MLVRVTGLFVFFIVVILPAGCFKEEPGFSENVAKERREPGTENVSHKPFIWDAGFSSELPDGHVQLVSDSGPAHPCLPDGGDELMVRSDAGHSFSDAGDFDEGDAGAAITICDIYEQVFQAANCIICHRPAAILNGGLNLLQGAWEASLVNVTSNQYGETLVVPGDPENSLLYKKLSGDLPLNGSLGDPMPLGASMISEDMLQLVHDWIAHGASLDCEPGVGAWDPGPNTLNQASLFQCNGDEGSSPPRIRRLERKEWTHAVGKPFTETTWGSVARNNPFDASEHFPYSTYAKGVSIDEAVLGLYLMVIPEAGTNWAQKDPDVHQGDLGVRAYDPYNDDSLHCMFDSDVHELTDECKSYFVDRFLEKAALFRTPRTDEYFRARAHLEELLLMEIGSDSDASRKRTLQLFASAIWLTVGALYKTEIGDPADMSDERRVLTSEELGRALGALFSSFPPGASGLYVDEKYTAPPNGYWPEIQIAVANGDIQNSQTRNEIINLYFGGIDGPPTRTDAGLEEPYAPREDLRLDHSLKRRSARGEYWLNSKVQDFFREWLDYDKVGLIFKDTPQATSIYWEEGQTHSRYHPIAFTYENLVYARRSDGGDEALLKEQLDDTIARIVIEDTQVYQNLLTANHNWYIASNVAMLNDNPPLPESCTDDEDCAIFHCDVTLGVCADNQTGATSGACIGDICLGDACLDDDGQPDDWTCQPYPICVEMLVEPRRCGVRGADTLTSANLMYNHEIDVPTTTEGRWVDLPANQRSGVLTHPAWLAAHGGNFEDGPSAIYRGKWVQENLLCEMVPPLEFVTVEAQLIARHPGKSARQRIEESIEGLLPLPDGGLTNHSAEQPYITCLACHSKMNALGKPFEAYNHAGLLRASNHQDERFGDGVVLKGFPGEDEDITVNGAIELSLLLANSSHAKRCFLRQAFRYFMGRDETLADACALEAMEQAYDEAGSFKAALKALVNSDVFLYRDSNFEEGGPP
tara:strand:- start:2523 stop:5471 length:2949 start_codon:yes stop_codon:yes gene_type:complete